MIASDMQTIEKALKRLRTLAYQCRYGGLMDDYELAKDALAALERVQQPRLFGENDAEPE
jgi:hypothetical protein